jgi:hypothetical protein
MARMASSSPVRACQHHKYHRSVGYKSHRSEGYNSHRLVGYNSHRLVGYNSHRLVAYLRLGIEGSNRHSAGLSATELYQAAQIHRPALSAGKSLDLGGAGWDLRAAGF